MRSLILSLILVLSVAVGGGAINRVTDRLGLRDGLSNNFVTDIAQDGFGFLWIATDNGLNRFDGERFLVFSEKDSTLKGNSVNSLFYDDVTGYMWVGTKKGVDLIDTRTLRKVALQAPADVADFPVTDFAPDGDKGIYILGRYTFIGYFDREADSCRVYREADFNGLIMSMYCAGATPDGRLVAGQENYGLSIIDIKNRTHRNYMHDSRQTNTLPANDVKSVLVTRRGDLYAGTEHGVCRFDSASQSFEPVELSDARGAKTGNGSVISMTELADGTLLASCSDVLFQDSFGNLWIGTPGNGLEFIPANPPVFEKVSQSQGYAGTGIIAKGGIPAEVQPYLNNKSARIAAMARIDNELLVSVTGEGIFSVDERSRKASRLIMPYDKDYANTIYNLGDTVTLLGTQRGLYEYRDGLIRRNEEISGATGYLVPNGILVDRHGYLWIGTYGNGIFIFDRGNNLAAHINTSNGLASNAVKQLFLDSHNQVWVAAQDGLSLISDIEHPDDIRIFNYDNGLPDISIRSLVEDAKGNIWIASNNQLCRYNVKTRSIESFGDRLKLTESTFVDRTAARGEDGTLYFGTLDGIYAFRPKDFDRQMSRPSLKIVAYSIPGEAGSGQEADITHYNPGTSIELPYGRHMVKLLFSVPDFSMRGKETYVYTLEGAPEQWLPLPESHELVLGNLSSGTHVLRIRAARPDGASESDDELRLEISVPRPWWLMWWAIAVYVLLGSGLVFMILRYGRKRNRQPAEPQSAEKVAAGETAAEETPSAELSLVDKEFLNRFTSLVEDNMGRPDLDMEFLQAELGMSHSTLYRRLKNLTGMSGNEFIKKCRLKKGHDMLLQGFSVSETAYACGFSDPGYFRTCFKSEYGKAPSEMRKK